MPPTLTVIDTPAVGATPLLEINPNVGAAWNNPGSTTVLPDAWTTPPLMFRKNHAARGNDNPVVDIGPAVLAAEAPATRVGPAMPTDPAGTAVPPLLTVKLVAAKFITAVAAVVEAGENVNVGAVVSGVP